MAPPGSGEPVPSECGPTVVLVTTDCTQKSEGTGTNGITPPPPPSPSYLVVVGAVAWAEPATVLAGACNRHAAQVGADAQHNEPARSQREGEREREGGGTMHHNHNKCQEGDARLQPHVGVVLHSPLGVSTHAISVCLWVTQAGNVHSVHVVNLVLQAVAATTKMEAKQQRSACSVSAGSHQQQQQLQPSALNYRMNTGLPRHLTVMVCPGLTLPSSTSSDANASTSAAADMVATNLMTAGQKTQVVGVRAQPLAVTPHPTFHPQLRTQAHSCGIHETCPSKYKVCVGTLGVVVTLWQLQGEVEVSAHVEGQRNEALSLFTWFSSNKLSVEE